MKLAVSVSAASLSSEAEFLARSHSADSLCTRLRPTREVAFKVIRRAQELGIDTRTELRKLSDEQLKEYIHSNMYDPLSSTSANGPAVNGSKL